jgi:hypothetical protein
VQFTISFAASAPGFSSRRMRHPPRSRSLHLLSASESTLFVSNVAWMFHDVTRIRMRSGPKRGHCTDRDERSSS